MAEMETILVSACLIGINCRYDGTGKRDDRVLKYLEHKIAIPVCPELLAGFGIPRLSAEIESGDGFDVLAGKARVILKDGRDVTREFLSGARQSLKIASFSRAGSAILKEQSPSCGVNFIYHRGKPVRGSGIFTAMLSKEGFQVQSEKELFEK